MFGISLVAGVARCWQLSLVPSCGPEFLHIRYQGTGDKVVDHTAVKISRLEVIWDPSAQSPGFDDCPLEGTLPRSADNRASLQGWLEL